LGLSALEPVESKIVALGFLGDHGPVDEAFSGGVVGDDWS